MRRFVSALAATALSLATAHAGEPAPPAPALPAEMAPAPKVLLAQAPVDDSDLKDEETLEALKQEEIAKEAWSMGAAIGLSLVPGGGAGLIYAEEPYAAIVPYV